MLWWIGLQWILWFKCSFFFNIYLCWWSLTCTGRSCRSQSPSRSPCLSWSPAGERSAGLWKEIYINSLHMEVHQYFFGFLYLAAGERNYFPPNLPAIRASHRVWWFPPVAKQKNGQREGGFDCCVLPAVAPQVGHVQGFRRSEWGCTGWITPGRKPFYLRCRETVLSDHCRIRY